MDLESGHRRVHAGPISRVGSAECAFHFDRSGAEEGDSVALVVVPQTDKLCRPQRHIPEDVLGGPLDCVSLSQAFSLLGVEEEVVERRSKRQC